MTRNATNQETFEINKIYERINRLKREKDAIIVAHHYAPVEVHEISDVLADSRGFFEAIKNGFKQKLVIIVAPTFFAEIAAALLPDKKIIIPVKSECPVANHVNYSFDKISAFKEAHPDIPLLCYATSPLNIKLLADYIAFPGEVVQIANAAQEETLLFIGEKNCALDASKKTTKKLIVYKGNPTCNVYDAANSRDVEKIRQEYPDATLLAHPECKEEVLEKADNVIGTGAMHDLIKRSPVGKTFILATELGFFQRMKNEFPVHNFVHLSPYLACNVFKVFRIECIVDALENPAKEIKIDKIIGERISKLVNNLYS